MTLYRLPIIFCLLLTVCGVASAQGASPFEEGNRRVQVELVADRNSFQPSDSDQRPVGKIGVKMHVEEGWHIYWENSGEAGQATQVDFTLPEGWREGPVEYPAPAKFIERGEIITYGYEGTLLLAEEVFNPPVVSKQLAPLTIRASASWLVCKEICVPGSKELTLTIPISDEQPLAGSDSAELFRSTALTVPRANSRDLPVAVATALMAGEVPSLEVRVSGLPQVAAAQIAELIQAFPREVPRIVFGVPKLSLTESYTQILFPLAQRGGEQMDTISATGIVTLAKELTGLPFTQSLDWEFKFSKAEIEKLPKVTGQVEGLPLTYREIRHGRAPPKVSESAPAEPSSFLIAVLAGLFAGMILNLMPCVLPVLSLKVMSLSLNRDLPKRERLKKAISYLCGIEATFIVLAIFVSALRNVGMNVGWGFQFQHPGFVLSLALVVLFFALGFFDLYFVTVPGAGKLDQVVSKSAHPAIKSFGEGVLVTLLSTPCTAPFLGTALAFAFAQPPAVSVIVFLSIGRGLAAPYILVALVPAFAALIPRPGNWMVRLKELMGFFLLGTLVWLLFVLESLLPGSSILTLGLCVWMTFLLWLRRPLSGLSFFEHHSRLSTLLPVLLIVLSFAKAAPKILENRMPVERITRAATDSWTPYTPELTERLTAEGKVVFIDFTADWCISCKFNERFVLNTPTVERLFADLQISQLKADWTDGSKMITDSLERYGAHGVPLYVIAGPNGRKKVLPTILTQSMVVEAVNEFVKQK